MSSNRSGPANPQARRSARLGRVRLFVVLLFVWLGIARAAGETILVLPLFNLSGSSNLEWICESVSEAIRESLASEGLLVLSRKAREEGYHRLAIRQYAQLTEASVIKLGEAVDAGFVVYGKFELSPARPGSAPSRASLRITARVLDMERMRSSRDFTVSGPLDDLGLLQSHLAWLMLQRFLEPSVVPSEEQFREHRPLVRLDAMENYIRGLLAADQGQKHRFFTQAARLGPNFSQPCFQLGRLRWENKDYRVAAGWLERVSATDMHYHEATFLLGLCRYYLGDFAKAQTAFESLLRSVPLGEVWNNLGAAQSRRNLPEALESFEKALERDPGDPAYNFNVGYELWKGGEYEEAAESFRAVLDHDPEDSVAARMLGRCLKKSGPRQGETRFKPLYRLKLNFDEMAYREAQAAPAGAQ